jgi:hypothetical protein
MNFGLEMPYRKHFSKLLGFIRNFKRKNMVIISQYMYTCKHQVYIHLTYVQFLYINISIKLLLKNGMIKRNQHRLGKILLELL